MAYKKIGLIGYGHVGKTLIDQLSAVDPTGEQFAISAIGSRSLGLIELENIPPRSVTAQIDELKPNIESKTENGAIQEINSWLQEGSYDILVEATISDYNTGGPALNYIRTALEQGKDAVTANKAPIALALNDLQAIAAQTGARLRYESTVMDGTPIISLFRKALPNARVERIRGILNSTTNLVLDTLYDGMSLEQGIKKAQKLGIAETDPSLDLSGADAVAKLVIIVNSISKRNIKISDVMSQALTEETFAQATNTSNNDRTSILRLISIADFNTESYRVSLMPVQRESIFYGCRGASSIVEFSLEMFGELAIVEQDPRLGATAFGIYTDLMDLI